jgi:hypothetical protein
MEYVNYEVNSAKHLQIIVYQNSITDAIVYLKLITSRGIYTVSIVLLYRK